MRLDKLLANQGYGSRKEVHELIKKGRVTVNGFVERKKDRHIDGRCDTVALDGENVSLQTSYYVKLHKPAGYVTAVDDAMHRTVMELLPPSFVKLGVVPVGRLDKDTEGLLILTNDGPWGHRLINGKKHVPKRYYLHYEGQLPDNAIDLCLSGIDIGEESLCKPAKLELLDRGQAYLTIEEGKFHQVKRMFMALGCTVTYLKRETVADIDLRGIEEPGDYVELTASEIDELRS